MVSPELQPDIALIAEVDRAGEACGVFGIYAPGEPVDGLAYQGLMALQHRGQEGSGIALSDGTDLNVTRDIGLAREAIMGRWGLKTVGLTSNEAYIAIGHNRYATAKDPSLSKVERDHMARRALQPMLYGSEDNHAFSLAHNGHVEGLDEVAAKYDVDISEAASDSEAMMWLIGDRYDGHGNIDSALMEMLPQFTGAFSIVISTPERLIAARDRQGFRPLHLGQTTQGGWVVASEIAALDIVNAEPVREVEPGEIISINSEGFRTQHFAEAEPAACGFEFVYFSRPDNKLFGERVYSVRKEMGHLLAKADASDGFQGDIVLGMPSSGLIAGRGYAEASGIPNEDGLVRNNYVDRSFIASTQNERVQKVRNKINIIPELVEGKSVVVVDDSIVRGTTMRVITDMLRQAGAREVHLRISSPPYRNPCFYGMDTSRQHELLAANMTIDEMREHMGADSLRFLSDEDMQVAVGKAAGKICTACTTGVYPTEIPVALGTSITKSSLAVE